MTESGPSLNLSNKTVSSYVKPAQYTTKEYWESRYKSGQTSGYGSYGEQLERKLKIIEKLEGIASVTEIGCGDFNFGKNVMFRLKLPLEAYTGYDIAENIVARNKALYPKCSFSVLKDFPDKTGDLLMCVDVILHLLEDKEYEQFLNNLSKLWSTGDAKYLVLTAYERNEVLAGHVRIRKFDPTPFGSPITREIVEQDGEHYLYVFKK